MIEHSFLERHTLPLLQTRHQLADGGWNSVLHPTRHSSPPSPRFDLFLDIRVGDCPLVVEEGRNDHRGHVVALRLRQLQQRGITLLYESSRPTTIT